MDFVRQTVSGALLNSIISLPPLLRNNDVEIIVLPVVEPGSDTKMNYKCNVGFAKGPDIPESFFEPLPEEDLQLWGL